MKTKDKSIAEVAEETVVGTGCYPNGYNQNVLASREALAAAAACGVGPSDPCPRFVIGAPVTTLTVTSTCTITITLNLLMQRGGGAFLPTRLIIPAEFAAGCRLLSVKCGNQPIMVTNDPIPGEAFSSANQVPGNLPFIAVASGTTTVNTIEVVLFQEAATAAGVPFALEGILL